MRRMLRLAGCAGLMSAFFMVVAPQASAYIDPGSTNFLIQLLLGSLFGVGLALATFWRRVVGFFGRLFGRAKD